MVIRQLEHGQIHQNEFESFVTGKYREMFPKNAQIIMDTAF